MVEALRCSFNTGSQMPQSLIGLTAHIIFSTKGREPLIDAELKPHLFAYMATVIKDVGGKAVLINGMPDHVHVLTHLPATVSVSDVLRTVKANASRWVHETYPDRAAFGWQRGYAAFSVSASNVDDVRRYVADQEERHRTLSFQDEYRAFLRKHGIEFDERYVWD
jgi:putative transposase